ncbi:hypothetical protein [Rugamonas sp. DEMB1]|uniref:hypothetical protein n=1 Tax=Rugamonas sp. DEMB1 TaxID=3039386 RepID=UPI00244A54CD|nr:hypothetical protein [Rugamonas sp. DEMB1]WGG48918.1 hypothetical protein QC826_20020 [Rugamonas sp. DEMB1]
MAENTCAGDEPRANADIFDLDGNWFTTAAMAQECYMNYLIAEWGAVFGWGSWAWRDGPPVADPPLELPEDPLPVTPQESPIQPA